MYQPLLTDAKFHQLLLSIDDDLAARCRAGGCRICGSRLDSARFPRKPRGGPRSPEGDWRKSLCCAAHGCRKRTTPASVRFLGRKVYGAPAVIVVSALQHGAKTAGSKLAEALGVSRRTVGRWRAWWLWSFPQSRLWKAMQSAFMPPVEAARLPASLLDRFEGGSQDRLLALLRLLGPMTGGGAMHTF